MITTDRVEQQEGNISDYQDNYKDLSYQANGSQPQPSAWKEILIQILKSQVKGKNIVQALNIIEREVHVW